LLAAGQITTSGGNADPESKPTSVRTSFRSNATASIMRRKCDPRHVKPPANVTAETPVVTSRGSGSVTRPGASAAAERLTRRAAH